MAYITMISQAMSADGYTVIIAYYDRHDRPCIRIQIHGETFKLTRYETTRHCLLVMGKLINEMEESDARDRN